MNVKWGGSIMKYKSVFDIIGPVMIGPSSSHTAGAARIGRVARSLFGKEPTWARIHLYGSFAETYKGHGTDVAILVDYLILIQMMNGLKLHLRLPKKRDYIEFIEETQYTDHPNTARVVIGDEKGELELVGISIGGGKMEITELNGFQLKLSGNHPAILVVHDDRSGAIASVANV